MSNATGRLPDFIFGRRRDIEEEVGLVLAGTLVTDIPKGSRPRKRDQRLIQLVISQLVRAVQSDPSIVETGMWRRGTKPPEGLAPPFDDHLMEERCKRCICVTVRVDGGPDEVVKLDSDLLRQMFGNN